MGTKIGIVYAAGSKLPRRIIIPDRDEELDDPTHVQPGEAILLIGRKDPHDIHSVKQYIADHHKMAVTDIPSGRCVLVHEDSRLVADTLVADPDLDFWPNHEIIATERACKGWKHEDGKFLARYAVVTPAKQELNDPVSTSKVVTVEDVIWLDPDNVETPKDRMLVEHTDIEIGQTVRVPMLINAPSSGTRKI